MAARIIDLSLPIYEGMTTFPTHWHPLVEITQLGRHGIENRETRKLVLGTHTGTHCDAPRHFVEGGRTVDKLPLDILIGPALVVDFSSKKPKQEIGVEDFVEQLGDRSADRLIIRFDWSKYYNKMEYYTDHPYLSEAAAHWLVDRGVKLLAMDTPTPDNPVNGWRCQLDSPVHKILLRNGLVVVEYLCNLEALKQTEVELIVLPLKIKDGDGAPARCVAIET